MTVRDCSGRYAMRSRLVLLLALLGLACPAAGAEAPGGEDGMFARSAPVPLPPEAEAAHQDLVQDPHQERWLDEAVFTEISPITVPEIGIALPPDQEN
jgi:hypothetical protein